MMEPGKGQQEDWKHSRQYSASIITVTVWDLQETLAGRVPLGLTFLIQNYTGVWCYPRKLTILMSRHTGSKSPKLMETPGTVNSSVSAGVVLTSHPTPLQGLEIVNPQAAEKKVAEANQKYFSSMAEFLKVKGEKSGTMST